VTIVEFAEFLPDIVGFKTTQLNLPHFAGRRTTVQIARLAADGLVILLQNEGTLGDMG
jgi:hypothetical protein